MNKSELIAEIASAANLTKAESARALDAFTGTVTKALKKGVKISLVGFCTIEKVTRKAKTARNPRTGKEIKVPAKKVAKFKAGKVLNDALK